VNAMDFATRALTADEETDRAALLPALECWTRYLARMGWVDTLDGARGEARAVRLRERGRGELTEGVRLAVHPPFALLYWQQRMAPAGQVGAVSLSMLVAALEFMGAGELVRFSPAAEMRPSSPRVRAVAGWWHLSRECVRRLGQAQYVPVLTARPGRRRDATPATPAPRAQPLRLVAGDPAPWVGVLRDYVRPDRATALLQVAVSGARPLCTRRAGRPPAGGSASLPVVLSSVLVHLSGVADYAAQNRDRLGLPAAGLSVVRDGLSVVRAANPSLLVASPSLAALDSGGTLRRQCDWWRVPLAGLGLTAVDPDTLAGEIAAWRLGRSMSVVAEDVESRRREVIEGAAPRMPKGTGPDDVFPDLAGVYVFESDRAAMTRAERFARGLLYPNE